MFITATIFPQLFPRTPLMGQEETGWDRIKRGRGRKTRGEVQEEGRGAKGKDTRVT